MAESNVKVRTKAEEGLDQGPNHKKSEQMKEELSKEHEHHLVDSLSFLDAQSKIPEDQKDKYEAFVLDLAETENCSNAKEWTARILSLRKIHKVQPRKAQMKALYTSLQQRGAILSPNLNLEQYLTSRQSRSLSGVLVIGVLMSPYPKYVDWRTGQIKQQRFSCKSDCFYCPKEPGMPRSYLSTEAAVARAARVNFDPIDQFYARATTLKRLGHDVDKIELLVLGGTFCQFPADYSEQFIRDLFWAANTFYDGNEDYKDKRARKSLAEEIKIHETASKCRIIGLTLETRPDTICDFRTIRKFREYGATRLQLGVQHTDDEVLKTINRGCYHRHTVKALRMLKNSGYKIDIHLMPNLPGSDPEKDEAMFRLMLKDENCQADQWKVYPCQTVEFSTIKKWFEEGKYKPYSLERLMKVIVGMKAAIHPWIRLNRIFRALPAAQITSGITMSNFRQHMYAQMEAQGLKCRCIRCREIGTHIRREELSQKLAATKQAVPGRAEAVTADLRQKLAMRTVLRRRQYQSSGGTELFISMESEDESVLKGFVRLRLPPQWIRPAERAQLGVSADSPFLDGFQLPEDGRYGELAEYEQLHTTFPELYRAALIREAHVYGAKQKAKGTTTSRGATGESVERNEVREQQLLTAQSKGYGSKLMAHAEAIAKSKGYLRMAVIAGVGTRFYYRLKLGYQTAGSYVVKDFAETRVGGEGRGDVNTKQAMSLCSTLCTAILLVVVGCGLLYVLSSALSLVAAAAFIGYLDYVHFHKVSHNDSVNGQLLNLSKIGLAIINVVIALKFFSVFDPTVLGAASFVLDDDDDDDLSFGGQGHDHLPNDFGDDEEESQSLCAMLWTSQLAFYVMGFYFLKMVLVKRMMLMVNNPMFGNDSGVQSISWENRLIIPTHVVAFTACELLVLNYSSSRFRADSDHGGAFRCHDDFNLLCTLTAGAAIVGDGFIYLRFCKRWYAIMQVLMEENAFIVLLQCAMVCVAMTGCTLDAIVHSANKVRDGPDFNALDSTFSFAFDCCIIAASLVLSFTDSVEHVSRVMMGDQGHTVIMRLLDPLKYALHIM